MINTNTQPQKLVIYNRDGLIEREHFGYVVKCDKIHVSEKIGDDKNYPFYMRSCAKPLQASLIIDYELDKKFNMSDEEIAICCASHAGERIHIEILENLLKKFEISRDKLKCGEHSPISESAKSELLKNNENPSVLHNNCSGKHIMMIALCKLNDWDTDNYDNINHPLQQEIKKKIYSLCNVKKDYPVTKDGCGVPIYSMPLSDMVNGYLNLFNNPKYERIKNSFLKCPYIIGGENRTDTKIMENSENLIAKVGAGGLCVVVNTETEEAFIVKICDTDMTARETVTIDLINNLHWANIDISHSIKTVNGDVVGKIETLL